MGNKLQSAVVEPQGRRRIGAYQRSWRNMISRETCGKSFAELSYLVNLDKSKKSHVENAY